MKLSDIMAMLKEMTDAETRLGRADHEESREEFARNRADHEEFREEFARNRADHEEFREEFARNRADHAELIQRFTRLEVLFEQFAHDAKVYGEGIQGINQRLEAWQAEFDRRVTSLEMRMGAAGGT